MRRWILLGVLWAAIGVPLVLLLAFLGVPLPFGIAWILVAAAVFLIAQQGVLDESGPWPPPAPSRLQRGSDVSRLAWAIDPRTGVVGPSLRRRVAALADRRLREHGVAPDQPDAVDAVLGPGAHAALIGAELRIVDLERILRTLESSSAPSNTERA